MCRRIISGRRENSQSEKAVGGLGRENRSLKERCSTAEEKEKAGVSWVEHLSEDVVDLTDQVTKLTLDQEEERIHQKKAEEDLLEFKGFVLDLGFMHTVRQAAFFYQVPIDEGKFDNRKDIYWGELVSAMYVPDEEEEDDEDGEHVAAEGNQSTPKVILSD